MSCHFSIQAQLGAYLGYASFNTPNNDPYLETYLTFSGKHFTRKRVNGQFQSSVNIGLRIMKDSLLVKALKYNLKGPAHSDTANSPAFIDCQRFALKNSNYRLIIDIHDNYNPQAKKESISSDFNIDFADTAIDISSIELVESYSKSTNPGILSKSGMDLVPYGVKYFPDDKTELIFYAEAYHTDKILGTNKMFIFSYYLEPTDPNAPFNQVAAFKKTISAAVTPLLAKLNLTGLRAGTYRLVLELKDENNQIRAQRSMFIQRQSKKETMALMAANKRQIELNNYFGSCNNSDTLKMFVECLWPIANGVDKERIINQAIKKDNLAMKNFVIDFWTRRAADTTNALKLWSSYYQQVQQVMALFKCGKMPGYYTDRGRAYLQYGAPNQRSQQPNEPNTFPYEIWQYYKITDQVNGQSYSNRKFVFVSKNLADDCYQLVHSDMRGEINNPRWQYEVTRRNSNGLADPDNTTPGGTETNHFNEIYNNPR